MIEHGGGIIARERERVIRAALADALGLPADIPPDELMAAADARAASEADARWLAGKCECCIACEYSLLGVCAHTSGDFPHEPF